MLSIHFGLFDSESYWNDSRLAALPKYNNTANNKIILSMDELLFMVTQPDDILITNNKFDSTLYQYLTEIGFSFRPYYIKDLISPELNNNCINNFLKINYIKEAHLEPYAMVFEKLITPDLPTYSNAKKVNSKRYSTELNHKFGYLDSNIVESLEELINCCYSQKGSFLIKEYYGVSGKGSFLIENVKVLKRILKYLEKQVLEKKEIGFIVEPRFNKYIDFSSHYYLYPDGNYELISVERIINTHDTVYFASTKASSDFCDFLDQRGYFSEIEKYVRCLYQDGYFGYINFDSMITESNGIVPVIEINARKSMGMLHHCAETNLNIANMSVLQFINIGVTKEITFECILDNLDRTNLLFGKSTSEGILPVSANTIFGNQNEEHKNYYKGRFYFLSVGSTDKVRYENIEKLKKVITDLNMIVF